MLQDSKRALRRHHLLRIKAKARRIIALWMSDAKLTEPEHERLACQLANNRKPCSCFACGHQRKWHGPTMQEIRQDAKEKSHD